MYYSLIQEDMSSLYKSVSFLWWGGLFCFCLQHRIIVVRETDGTLREADWHERDRINQIYNPLPGRELRTPLMFSPQYLEVAIIVPFFSIVIVNWIKKIGNDIVLNIRAHLVLLKS